MEQKFPVESDFGKYFLYNLYLQTTSGTNAEDRIHLNNSNTFNLCLNLNRNALRGFNCAEKKRAVDKYFTANADNFAEFKEKIGTNCNNKISTYLASNYHAQSTYADSSLYERLSSQTLLESNLNDVMNCLGSQEELILFP